MPESTKDRLFRIVMRDTDRILVDEEDGPRSFESDEYAVVEFKCAKLPLVDGCIALSPGQVTRATGALGRLVKNKNEKGPVQIPLTQALFIY